MKVSKKIFFAISIVILAQFMSLKAFSISEIDYLNLEWWKNYNDEILVQNLVDLYDKNQDLKNTKLKIKQSEKLASMGLANELPSISFDGLFKRDLRSSIQQYGNMKIPNYSQSNFQLPLMASYEIDIFGKNHFKTKSLKSDIEISKLSQRATYITLTSDFVSNYYNLVMIDKLLELQEELINTQNEIVLKTKQKQDFGMGSIDLVLQEQKTLSVLEEEKNNLKDKKDNVINVLKNYLSINDDKINRIKFDDIVLIHDMPESLDSKTIESRPDYLANLEFLKKIGYDVKAARRELLPSFTVFGALGFNAYDISNIFKNSTQLANIGIVPNLDIFDGGYKYAYLKLQKYKYDEALNNFRKVVVEDLNELNLALNQNKTSKENYLELTNQKQIEDNIYDISLTKENIGTLSNLDTLYEKENKLLVDRKNVENTINYIISTISLYKASDGKNILDKENL